MNVVGLGLFIFDFNYTKSSRVFEESRRTLGKCRRV